MVENRKNIPYEICLYVLIRGRIEGKIQLMTGHNFLNFFYLMTISILNFIFIL